MSWNNNFSIPLFFHSLIFWRRRYSKVDFFKVKVGFVFFSKPVRDIDLTLFHRDLCRIFVGQFSFQLPAIMTESDITDNRKWTAQHKFFKDYDANEVDISYQLSWRKDTKLTFTLKKSISKFGCVNNRLRVAWVRIWTHPLQSKAEIFLQIKWAITGIILDPKWLTNRWDHIN